MANVYKNRPISLDTVMASGYQASAPFTTNLRPLRVTSVRLVGGSTASSYTIVEPISGNILAQGACAAGGVEETAFASPALWRDFKLTVIAGTGAIVIVNTR
jgi:hypothetical protein